MAPELPSKKGKKIKKIMIVDDHPVVLAGMATIVNDVENLTVCGQASSRKEVFPILKRSKPDLIIVDLFLQEVLSLDLIQDLRAKFPDLLILVLSIQNDALFAERSLRAGADGYVAKEEATSELLRAIDALLGGSAYVSKKIVDRMSFKIVNGNPRLFVGKLSNRELQVLQLIGAGVNIRQIAAELKMSAKTVETYCERIKKKLHLPSANDLLRFATQWRTDPRPQL